VSTHSQERSTAACVDRYPLQRIRSTGVQPVRYALLMRCRATASYGVGCTHCGSFGGAILSERSALSPGKRLHHQRYPLNSAFLTGRAAPHPPKLRAAAERAGCERRQDGALLFATEPEMLPWMCSCETGRPSAFPPSCYYENDGFLNPSFEHGNIFRYGGGSSQGGLRLRDRGVLRRVRRPHRGCPSKRDAFVNAAPSALHAHIPQTHVGGVSMYL
jgi:hypothetical protein